MTGRISLINPRHTCTARVTVLVLGTVLGAHAQRGLQYLYSVQYSAHMHSEGYSTCTRYSTRHTCTARVTVLVLGTVLGTHAQRGLQYLYSVQYSAHMHSEGYSTCTRYSTRHTCTARVTVLGVCVCVCSNLPPHTLESQKRDTCTNGFIAIRERFSKR